MCTVLPAPVEASSPSPLLKNPPVSAGPNLLTEKGLIFLQTDPCSLVMQGLIFRQTDPCSLVMQGLIFSQNDSLVLCWWIFWWKAVIFYNKKRTEGIQFLHFFSFLDNLFGLPSCIWVRSGSRFKTWNFRATTCVLVLSSYTATIFKPTQQNSSGRLRVGRFGLEIWNIGDDMIISMEIAVSSISNKFLQLHLVQVINKSRLKETIVSLRNQQRLEKMSYAATWPLSFLPLWF